MFGASDTCNCQLDRYLLRSFCQIAMFTCVTDATGRVHATRADVCAVLQWSSRWSCLAGGRSASVSSLLAVTSSGCTWSCACVTSPPVTSRLAASSASTSWSTRTRRRRSAPTTPARRSTWVYFAARRDSWTSCWITPGPRAPSDGRRRKTGCRRRWPDRETECWTTGTSCRCLPLQSTTAVTSPGRSCRWRRPTRRLYQCASSRRRHTSRTPFWRRTRLLARSPPPHHLSVTRSFWRTSTSWTRTWAPFLTSTSCHCSTTPPAAIRTSSRPWWSTKTSCRCSTCRRWRPISTCWSTPTHCPFRPGRRRLTWDMGKLLLSASGSEPGWTTRRRSTRIFCRTCSRQPTLSSAQSRRWSLSTASVAAICC